MAMVGLAPAQPAPPQPARPQPQPEQRPSQRAARETRALEQRIEQLEEELGAVTARLSQPEAYEDHEAVADDGRRHQELQEELAYLYREWEMRVG